MHEGLATWYRTHSKTQTLKAIIGAWPANLPIDDWRTREKCASVMIDYMNHYQEEDFEVVGIQDSQPMVEVAFTIDTGMFLSCAACGMEWDGRTDTCTQCGEPLERIEYGGILDTLVGTGGQLYVLEHKTTSKWTSYYFDQFKPNNQVTGYIWAGGKLSDQPIGGAIINAIGIYKSSVTKFDRQITTRSPENIEEWLANVRQTCEMIRRCEQIEHWPMFTPSCTMYGKCEYHEVHRQQTPMIGLKLLDQDYVRDKWDYEQRAGVKDGEAD